MLAFAEKLTCSQLNLPHRNKICQLRKV